MTMRQAVVDTAPGMVTVVSGSGVITALHSVCRARQPADIPVGPQAPQLAASFPVGRSVVSRCRSSRVAGGLTFAAGEVAAWAWG
jgi:hypothetical protein